LRPTGWQYAGDISTAYGVVDQCNFDPSILVLAEGDDMGAFSFSWYWSQKQQRDTVFIDGAGALWHSWLGSTATSPGQENVTALAAPPPGVVLVPGTLSGDHDDLAGVMRVYAIGTDGCEYGWSQPDTASGWTLTAWGIPRTPLPVAAGGLTPAQAAGLVTLQTAIAAVQSAVDDIQTKVDKALV
jgi:hypothetical protein